HRRGGAEEVERLFTGARRDAAPHLARGCAVADRARERQEGGALGVHPRSAGQLFVFQKEQEAHTAGPQCGVPVVGGQSGAAGAVRRQKNQKRTQTTISTTARATRIAVSEARAATRLITIIAGIEPASSDTRMCVLMLPRIEWPRPATKVSGTAWAIS